MQIFRFVSQWGFIQLQQSYKVGKVRIYGVLCIYKTMNIPTEKKANKQSKQMHAYECVDAYHIYEIPRQLILK